MKITREQKQGINKIAKKYGLKLVLIFGSQVSGKTHKESDLDIAVLGNKTLVFEKQLSLNNKLSVIFNKNVDLSIINTANPLLLFQVSKNSQLIFGNRQDYFQFRLNAFHRYNDYLPFFRMEEVLNKKCIRQYAH